MDSKVLRIHCYLIKFKVGGLNESHFTLLFFSNFLPLKLTSSTVFDRQTGRHSAHGVMMKYSVSVATAADGFLEPSNRLLTIKHIHPASAGVFNCMRNGASAGV